MITVDEYCDWQIVYLRKYPDPFKMPSERYGQAFVNYFNDRIKDMLPDPELFYETDVKKAHKMIMEKYVKE